MDKIIIEGGRRLEGTVKINGAKNAALPIMAACILAEGKSCIKDVPCLKDVETMMSILIELGVRSERTEDKTIELEVINEDVFRAPYDLVRTMRSSICVLGPLLAKRGRAEVSYPGGCVIGNRPVNLHIKGLQELGAQIEVKHGYIIAEAKKLRGKQIYLGGPFGSTVTGTCNVMMAATLAEGKTIIECAACEPEVEDLARFLNKMGARISGAGTPRVTIRGVEHLKGADHKVIPDRIEAGTFMIAGAVTGGNVKLKNIRIDHLSAVVHKLRELGVMVTPVNGSCQVTSQGKFYASDITTLPYPGLPTDLQAPMMVPLSIADGISVVTEKIFPDRFMHIAELNRMGADIRKEGEIAIINGKSSLSGAQVMASDLRASAALVLAGLVAQGKTEVNRVYHIDRGYEKIEERLSKLGAEIQRVS